MFSGTLALLSKNIILIKEKNPWKRKANPDTDLCITHLAYDKDDYFKSVEKGKSIDGIVTMGYPLSKKSIWRLTSHLTCKLWVH